MLKTIIDFINSNITVLTLCAVGLQNMILLIQLIALKKQILTNTYQIVEGKYDELVKLAINYKDFRRFLRIGPEALAKHSDETDDVQERYSLYVELWYTTYEDVFKMWKNKIISTERWRVWESWIDDIVKESHEFREVHRLNYGLYDKEFQQYIQSIINRYKLV